MTGLNTSNTNGDADAVLRASGVSRSFEGVRALSDVDLDVRRKEVVGLIGPNGAGKTTLVNMLTGFDYPSAGRVELEGRDVTRWPPPRRGRAGLARTFQQGRLFAALSVRENVELAALGVGAGPREARARATELLRALGIAHREQAPAAVMPHGDARKLGVARALAMRPRYVLMDEPAAGLPESEVPDFADVVRSVATDSGAGVLLIDHNMALIMEVCDRIYVLDQGRMLAHGAPQEIRRDLNVVAAYLGEGGLEQEGDDG